MWGLTPEAQAVIRGSSIDSHTPFSKDSITAVTCKKYLSNDSSDLGKEHCTMYIHFLHFTQPAQNIQSLIHMNGCCCDEPSPLSGPCPSATLAQTQQSRASDLQFLHVNEGVSQRATTKQLKSPIFCHTHQKDATLVTSLFPRFCENHRQRHLFFCQSTVSSASLDVSVSSVTG